jgi:caa(3)-type oxidase subunit IV
MEHSNEPYKYASHHSEAEGKKIRKMIWNMFWVLLAITSVEVGLGLTWKEMGIMWSVVKMTFIILTVAKAYFIVAYYMHLKHERTSLQNTIIIPYVFLGIYLIYMVVTEATYTNFMEYFF